MKFVSERLGTVGRWCDFPSHLTRDKKKPVAECAANEAKSECQKATEEVKEVPKQEAEKEPVASAVDGAAVKSEMVIECTNP